MTHQTPDAPLSQLRFLMEAVQAAESRAREAEQRLVVLENARYTTEQNRALTEERDAVLKRTGFDTLMNLAIEGYEKVRDVLNLANRQTKEARDKVRALTEENARLRERLTARSQQFHRSEVDRTATFAGGHGMWMGKLYNNWEECPSSPCAGDLAALSRLTAGEIPEPPAPTCTCDASGTDVAAAHDLDCRKAHTPPYAEPSDDRTTQTAADSVVVELGQLAEGLDVICPQCGHAHETSANVRREAQAEALEQAAENIETHPGPKSVTRAGVVFGLRARASALRAGTTPPAPAVRTTQEPR